jgi:Leucine-rich repeat (LRR) protein
MTRLPNLESLDVAHNKLENLPAELASLSKLYTVGNPLSQILPAYRNNNEKVFIDEDGTANTP